MQFTTRKYILFFVALSSVLFASCRYLRHLDANHPPVVRDAEYRGFYVDDFKKILGNDKSEELLLTWAKRNQFNALSLYMADILDCGEKNPVRQRLAAFIKAAKTKYGIRQVAGVESSAKWFCTDDPELKYLGMCTYNSQHPDTLENIDVFQLEDEWTHRNPSHTFNQYMNSLQPIYQAAHNQNPRIITESYVSTLGWWRPGNRASRIMQNSDRILLVNYRELPSFRYMIPELRTLAIAAQKLEKPVNVIVIFSVLDDHSGHYFREHSFAEGYASFQRQYQRMSEKHNIPEVIEKYIRIKGYEIFTYSKASQIKL